MNLATSQSCFKFTVKKKIRAEFALLKKGTSCSKIETVMQLEWTLPLTREQVMEVNKPATSLPKN